LGCIPETLTIGAAARLHTGRRNKPISH